jgi:hypothetical protein
MTNRSKSITKFIIGFFLLCIAFTVINSYSWDDGRFSISRGFNEERFQKLLTKNKILNAISDENGRLRDGVISLDDLSPKDRETWERYTSHLQGPPELHKNIVWAHHLGGEYKSKNSIVVIDLKGFVLTLEIISLEKKVFKVIKMFVRG